MHRTLARSRQRGMSFIGLIFVGVMAVSVFAIGGQSVPIFLEYKSIEKAASAPPTNPPAMAIPCPRYVPLLTAPVKLTTFRRSKAKTWKSPKTVTKSWCRSSIRAKWRWQARRFWSIASKGRANKCILICLPCSCACNTSFLTPSCCSVR